MNHLQVGAGTSARRRIRAGLKAVAAVVCTSAFGGRRRLLVLGIVVVTVGASLLSTSRPGTSNSQLEVSTTPAAASTAPPAARMPQPEVSPTPVAVSASLPKVSTKRRAAPKEERAGLGGPDGYALDAVGREPRDEARGMTVALARSRSTVMPQTTSSARRKPTPRAEANPLQVRYTKHTVLRGETLSTIAIQHRIDARSLQSVNGIGNPRKVQPGQVLLVPSRRGLQHVVRSDDTLEDISLAYRVSIDHIIAANGLEDPDAISVNQKLFLPNARRPAGAATAGARSSRASLGRRRAAAGSWASPVTARISSGFGFRNHPITGRWAKHRGTDFACITGTPITAVRPGKVTYAGRLGGYGNLVVLDHGNGYETRYGHASRIDVHVGQHVRQGQKIALSGSTGSTTGPHLHFEVRLNGSALDPMTVMR